MSLIVKQLTRLTLLVGVTGQQGVSARLHGVATVVRAHGGGTYERRQSKLNLILELRVTLEVDPSKLAGLERVAARPQLTPCACLHRAQGDLDIVCGFHLIDDDCRTIVIEGLGDSGLAKVMTRLQRIKRNDEGYRILYHPKVHPVRLAMWYMALDSYVRYVNAAFSDPLHRALVHGVQCRP